MLKSKSNTRKLSNPNLLQHKIYSLRGLRVMTSSDLAKLYRVKSKALIQAVKRNKIRFPEDFMFQMTWKEVDSLRSQIVTLKNGAITLVLPDKSNQGKHSKYRPFAFTEQGVAMLSSVLKSKRAVQVNIAIMRAFVQYRENLSAHKELAQKFKELESKVDRHDVEIEEIFKAIQNLMAIPEKPRKVMGFHAP